MGAALYGRFDVVMALALLLGLAGCRHQTPTSGSNTSGWRMQLTTSPAPPPVGRDTLFTLHLTDAHGQPVTGATVRLELHMTTMDMGANVVPLRERSAGVYSGQGQFTMGGAWNCRAAVESGGRRGERIFPIQAG